MEKIYFLLPGARERGDPPVRFIKDILQYIALNVRGYKK